MNDTLYEITRELVLLENYEEPQEQNGEDRLELFRQALDNLNMKFLERSPTLSSSSRILNPTV